MLNIKCGPGLPLEDAYGPGLPPEDACAVGPGLPLEDIL